MARLEGLANSEVLQSGQLSGVKTSRLLQEQYAKMNNIADSIFLVDANNIETFDLLPTYQKFIGVDLSDRVYVKEAKNTMSPVFSKGFLGLDGTYRIALASPIINRESGQYIGLIVASIPTVSFFNSYGNLHDPNLQFIAAYDKEGNVLASPKTDWIGRNWFIDPAIQDNIKNNSALNGLVNKVVFSGYPDEVVYDYGSGERLTTSQPVLIEGKPAYSLIVVTPTAQIYSEVESVLFSQRLEFFVMLIGTTASIAVLIAMLVKWNRGLDKKVLQRTTQLEKSNQELINTTHKLEKANADLFEANKKILAANQQLKNQDKMQKEFINIAAHELRTPLQPIIGGLGLLQNRLKVELKGDAKAEKEFEMVVRNADRLQRLAEDILELTIIEGDQLHLELQDNVDIYQLVLNAVQEIEQKYLGKRIPIIMNSDVYDDPKETPITVKCDPSRISRVIYNLLDNSMKFTEEGKIIVSIKKVRSPSNTNNQTTDLEIGNDSENKNNDNHRINKDQPNHRENLVEIKISDTGSGIDLSTMTTLFDKFKSKSANGLGVGLYLSKKIVESHGGEIWAENNKDEIGTTIGFTLPLEQQPSYTEVSLS
jgi:signal transduction histidine kinase